MKKSLFATLATLLILAFSIACAPPYRQTFNDEGKAKGWTQKQTNAAFASADRTFWSREAAENKYVIVYGKIPTAKVREQLEGVLHDLDSGLDPKNTEMVQYLATFGLRKDVEHDEEIALAIYDRIRAYELQQEFDAKMGETSEEGPGAEIAKGYNIRKIYVAKSLVEAFPFKSDQIEAAKKAGLLKPIEHAELSLDSTYDHKIPNPSNPDDENDFLWKGKKQSIRLTNYKIVDIEKPLDNKGDYIEGYRVIDGKQESLPALKVFFPQEGGEAVVLVDTDEEGQPGFGVPNLLEELADADNVQELLNNGRLLDELFAKKQKKELRKLPESKLFKIEIAKVGAPIDEWEKAPSADGWIVPFKYVSQRGDNYNVRVHFEKPKMDDLTAAHAHSEYAWIEYIEKEYTKAGERYEASSGRVIEYYKPRCGIETTNFCGPVKAKVVFDEDTKKVSFEFKDGSFMEGFITPGSNKFIEDTPYAKSYNEGQKRWWIEKSDRGSNVYDKRRSVGKPKEETGEYQGDTMEMQFQSFGARTPPSFMDKPKKP